MFFDKELPLGDTISTPMSIRVDNNKAATFFLAAGDANVRT